MSVNEILIGQADLNGGDSARRRRTPSKYAESIKELTKVIMQSFRFPAKLPKRKETRTTTRMKLLPQIIQGLPKVI